MSEDTFSKDGFGAFVVEGDYTETQRNGITYRATLKYDASAGAPDTMCEGFWPSLDPEDAGFIGEGKTEKDLQDHKEGASKIMASWLKGEWFYCGVVISAYKDVKKGGSIERVFLSSHAASVWGIECNLPGHFNAYLSEAANNLLDEAEKHVRENLAAILGEEVRTAAMALAQVLEKDDAGNDEVREAAIGLSYALGEAVYDTEEKG